MRKQRAIVVGIGTISVIHISTLEAMSDRVEIVGLCDHNPERLEPYRGHYACYEDLGTMLGEVEADVAHICLPHSLHLDAIRQCAERGIAVFTEKPVTANPEQAEALLAFVAQPGLPPIGVSFQNRYNPTFLSALEAVREGTYGKLEFVRGTVPWFRAPEYYLDAPWRGTLEVAGGGVMTNQAIHTLDQMLVLGGGQAREVRGIAGQLLGYPIEVEDSAMARLDMANGVEGLFVSTIAHVRNESVELKLYFQDGILEIRNGILWAQGHDGIETELCRDIPLGGSKSYYGSGHGAAIKAFYDAVRDGTDAYIHVADACPAVFAIGAIMASSEARQALTEVPQVSAQDLSEHWVGAGGVR